MSATVADVLLRRLGRLGVDALFANPGTDFPPLIEALARARVEGAVVPEPVTVPHENAAVAMAYGMAMVTGRPQAVGLHVGPGTANALCCLANAERERIPMVVLAGRTPVLEQGRPGARSLHIHWAQEMRDQAGMVRELVRWDYELRDPAQAVAVIDRAVALATSDPQGPVYLMLPREVLMAEADIREASAAARHAPARVGAPDPDAVMEAARLLARAERPLIVTAGLGRDPRAVPVLQGVAERFDLPVVELQPRWLNLPADSLMHLGYDPHPWVADADAILVIDCDVPWIPARASPRPSCRVIQMGPDPLFARYPMRSFASDVTIMCDPRQGLEALGQALARAMAGTDAAPARRAGIVEAHQAWRAAALAAAEASGVLRPMSMAWVSRCIDRARDLEGIVVNEYTLDPAVCTSARPGSFFNHAPAGGLGWGLGAAMGAKLAAPDREVIACVGDGSYLFANPVACHQVAQAQSLAFLTVVFDN